MSIDFIQRRIKARVKWCLQLYRAWKLL